MSNRQSTRRDFLQGKAAVRALAGVGETAELPTPAPRAGCTLSLTRKAMACEFEVQLVTQKDRNETAAGVAALDLIERLEDRLSIYRPQSAITRLNQAAQPQHGQSPEVSVPEDLLPLLMLCEDLYLATDGAFDATTGPLSRAWGFYERKGRLPSPQELELALQRTGWSGVELQVASQQLRFLKPDMEINFNGIGKGYALDEAADQLTETGVQDFLLHGGRSTLVARGNRPEGQPGWGIGVRHPLRPQQRLAEFHLHNAAFATSGSATQGFTHHGQRYGHVLDPRTGKPVQQVLSVSVIAPTGTAADALSTALMVMGPEQAQAFCREHPQISALFVLPSHHASKVIVEPVNLPAELWQPIQAE